MEELKNKAYYLSKLRDCWIDFSNPYWDENNDKIIKSRGHRGYSTLEDLYDILLSEKYITKKGLTPWDRRKNAHERRIELHRIRQKEEMERAEEFMKKHKNMVLGA